MKYSGETYSIVVHEGEIIAATDDYVEAANMASGINEENTDSAIHEAGYDPEELDDDERDEFGVMGGFEGGYAYSEEVTIPGGDDDYVDDDEEDEEDREEITEDDYFSTDKGDQFTYDELISAIDEFIKKKEQESDEEE